MVSNKNPEIMVHYKVQTLFLALNKVLWHYLNEKSVSLHSSKYNTRMRFRSDMIRCDISVTPIGEFVKLMPTSHRDVGCPGT